MESKITDGSNISFLTKPKIVTSKLPYVRDKREVYVNLYEIKLKKPLKLLQYPYETVPKLEAGDISIREKLFKSANKKLREIYNVYFVSGDSLYSTTEIKDVKSITQQFRGTEYAITINPFEESRTINQEDIQKDQLSKQFIELVVRDILHHNPNLDFYREIFVLNNKKQEISSDKNKNIKVNFYPGYKISFMQTELGNFLNVTLKNKILQKETVLEYLNERDYKKLSKDDKENLRESLIGRSFKVIYAKKNYVISDINFDRTPANTHFTYEGKQVDLINYYKQVYKINIKNKDQPLILVKKNFVDSKGEEQILPLWFVPELCHLSGLEDEMTKDFTFMRKLADYTKLNPKDRVNKTEEFLQLLNCTEKKVEYKISAKERKDEFGIDIVKSDKKFIAHFIKEPDLKAGGDKKMTTKDRQFKVLDKKNLNNWLCLYQKRNYDDAAALLDGLQKCSGAYGLTVSEPEWCEMEDRHNSAKDWINSVNDYMGTKKSYDFVVFLLGGKDYLYKDLKKHSLCTSGYISQVVKTRSLYNKRTNKIDLSVCSKILIQINSKLGGTSYKTVMDKAVLDRKLMLVGVDTSHVAGKRTGVGMVATMDANFGQMFSEEHIIEEKNKAQLSFCVGKFIKSALSEFNKKNKGLPGGIIIYRQGVSLQQKEFLKSEIKDIENECKAAKIHFYYILVNTKTTYKFFEKKGAAYKNPDAGLLIMDDVTSSNFFEFYLQPQEVTGGSATPSCFHVAYGDFNFPEIIPKLTYDLCHIYANWQGPVRIPNVIKCAEKLSKMTAKYTKGELHKDIKHGQAYL